VFCTLNFFAREHFLHTDFEKNSGLVTLDCRLVAYDIVNGLLFVFDVRVNDAHTYVCTDPPPRSRDIVTDLHRYSKKRKINSFSEGEK
jgi:hypothetical protein